uniref:Uncharacterized protein n=1 Tax=Alexandrium catenella TaxID=2925 RepID=A0A7S1WR03_ALECA|mmetsp:Transcript_83436/g.221361  ORF Transcript_83436/g.221361 Transcript_83436/m.221361 type:complete len:172 (+) Transcript_83436:75-590(+)
MILGGLFQFVWFCLALYLLVLMLIDVLRPHVLLHEAPVATGLRFTITTLAVCMTTATAPEWTGYLLPFVGFKESLFARCSIFKNKKVTPILMFALMFAAIGRAQQYELQFDANNVSWGWLITLIFAATLLNLVLYVLSTIVWVLTGCRKEAAAPAKKHAHHHKKKKGAKDE